MSDISPEEQIWEILRGALATRALGIVAGLGVAEILLDGPRSVDEVAQEKGADPDALHRLLRALASEGVFAEESPRLYRNTPASELLTTSGWGDFAVLFGGVWYRSVGELDAAGKAVFPDLFGSDFWSWLAAHPEERARFDRAMAQGSDTRIERLETIDWRSGETVVDVGGGNGSLLAELRKAHPDLREASANDDSRDGLTRIGTAAYGWVGRASNTPKRGTNNSDHSVSRAGSRRQIVEPLRMPATVGPWRSRTQMEPAAAARP